MKKGVETRLDGSTLVVRIPMRFQRRGGRKRIVAPDASVVAPNAKPACRSACNVDPLSRGIGVQF